MIAAAVRRRALLAAIAAAAITVACGKKGPPLPPLVLLPSPPSEFAATRRGDRVDVTFKVPASNTDRTAPADVDRVEIYAWTTPAPVNADEVIRRGTRIGSVDVNEPVDEDVPEEERPKPRPGGVNQDEVARVSETLSDGTGDGYRAYVAVGLNRRGRRGALSTRLAVPLVAPPAPPGQPDVTYDEQQIAIAWTAVTPPSPERALSYMVYRGDDAVITAAPVQVTTVVDKAIEWNQERCYHVRTVSVAEATRVESAASPERCVTLRDTFAPKAPEGLVGVAAEASISLIWNASTEADLSGYLVLRAIAPTEELAPVTPAPITDTNFRDTVPTGSRVTYAIQAVDVAGNRSAPSERITETAR